MAKNDVEETYAYLKDHPTVSNCKAFVRRHFDRAKELVAEDYEGFSRDDLIGIIIDGMSLDDLAYAINARLNKKDD